MPVTAEELYSFADPLDAHYSNLLSVSDMGIKREKQRSRVYFVLADNGMVKIGFTLDVERRFKRMQMDCPLKLYLIGVIKGDRYLESDLHMKFKKYRKRGEWFTVNDKILKYIKENSIDIKKSYLLKNIPIA